MSNRIIKLHAILLELRLNNNWYLAEIVEKFIVDLINEDK